MKKGLSLVLAAAVAASFTACGTGKQDDAISEAVMTEGRFLWSKSGTPMIIIDSTGPCTISTDDEAMFAEFTDGDLIELEFDGMIAESYPGQIHHVYGAELIEQGDIMDIDQDTLYSLAEMGHYAPADTEPEYTKATAVFIRTNEDKPALLLDGITPCELTNASEELFSGLTEGDMVEILYDGMLTRSYPAQIPLLVSITLLEDGEISDIDQSVREELVNIGWLENAE